MICGQCDKAITPGQPYEKRMIHGANGGGDVVYYHRDCRQPIPVLRRR